jgi:hypothetical protein
MNQRLSRVYLDRVDERREFICECADAGCTKGIVLTSGEYDAVRLHPTRFAIAVGHEIERVERLVSVNPEFSVVEKPVAV